MLMLLQTNRLDLARDTFGRSGWRNPRAIRIAQLSDDEFQRGNNRPVWRM